MDNSNSTHTTVTDNGHDNRANFYANSIQTPVDTEAELPRQEGAHYRIFYSLPLLRFSVLIRTLIIIDTFTILSLWLSGGDGDYFTNSITNFGFVSSVFDLAIMAAAKTVIVFPLYYLMEFYSMQYVNRTYDLEAKKKKTVTQFIVILISLCLFAYAVVKGSLVLNSYLNDKQYVPMHLTYNIALGFAVGFGLVEFLMSLCSFKAMRRLIALRILHRFNEDGDAVDEQGQAIKKPANLSRLFSLAKPEAWLLTGGVLCLCISTGSSMLAPLFFGQVIDAAQKSMAELNKTVLILLGVYVGGAIASCFRSWLFTLSGQRLVARLRSHLFNSIIKQEVAFFDVTRTGELTNRLSSDTQVIQNAVTVNISMLSRNLLSILGSLAVMFILNPSLTGVLLAVVPIISIAAVQYGKFLRRLQKDFQDRLADASTTAEEVISSIRTVRTFTSEPKASNLYWNDVEKSYKVGKRLACLQGIFEGTIGVLSSGAIVLVLWYGGKLVNEKIITAGQVTSFVLYTLQVAIAFGTLSSLYGDFMKAVGASVRVFELIDRKPLIPVEGGSSQHKLNGRIEFRNVHFTYPSRPDTEILKGVSFYVKPGQMVALVGPSGGGKSTIVNLIERFYDPDKGAILLDDKPVSSLNPLWFRQQLSMVSQEPVLFACSIKDNITYGKEASMDEVIDAARQANAHDFISSFDEGYDTLVGERGVRLSGGQKQRIAIARALIMDPTVLLLDEATSALDAESEHLVQEAIDRAMQSRTVIVIAHRLSTVRNASQVMVINKGVICEQGTHEQLLAENGIYKKLILRQLTAGRIDGATNSDNAEESNQLDEQNKTDDVDMIDLS